MVNAGDRFTDKQGRTWQVMFFQHRSPGDIAEEIGELPEDFQVGDLVPVFAVRIMLRLESRKQ